MSACGDFAPWYGWPTFWAMFATVGIAYCLDAEFRWARHGMAGVALKTAMGVAAIGVFSAVLK